MDQEFGLRTVTLEVFQNLVTAIADLVRVAGREEQQSLFQLEGSVPKGGRDEGC